MTVQWTVRAALTEERSKAEIKRSALQHRDETKSCYPHPKDGKSRPLVFLYFHLVFTVARS